MYNGGIIKKKNHYQSSLISRSWWSHSHKKMGSRIHLMGLIRVGKGGANVHLTRALDRKICTRVKSRNAVPPTVEASSSREGNLHGRGDDSRLDATKRACISGAARA